MLDEDLSPLRTPCGHPLRLSGFSRGSHVEVVSRTRNALISGGACILDYHMFSNAVLSLNFEISADRLPALSAALDEQGVRLDDGSLALLELNAQGGGSGSEGKNERLEGSISVNIINDEPVLRIEVPAVPG